MDSFVIRPRRTIIPTEKIKPAETSETTLEYESSLRKPPIKPPLKIKKITSPPARVLILDPLNSIPATRLVPKSRKTNSPI
jgi:hypothetical protein